jgi:hypothetical protein
VHQRAQRREVADGLRLATRGAERGDQQGDQHHDNADDDQQLHEREAVGVPKVRRRSTSFHGVLLRAARGHQTQRA